MTEKNRSEVLPQQLERRLGSEDKTRQGLKQSPSEPFGVVLFGGQYGSNCEALCLTTHAQHEARKIATPMNRGWLEKSMR